MKRLTILSIALMSFLQYNYAQLMVDGKEVKMDDIKYIEIEFFNTIGSNEVKVFIDYGQDISFLDRKTRLVSDRNGKSKVFNSKVGGLNWFYQQGWKILEVYNPKTGGNTSSNELIYILEKIE